MNFRVSVGYQCQAMQDFAPWGSSSSKTILLKVRATHATSSRSCRRPARKVRSNRCSGAQEQECPLSEARGVARTWPALFDIADVIQLPDRL
jgi:hypothetical protein